MKQKFIADDPLALEWLKQFDPRDVDLARSLLRTLELVSFSKFESAIRDLLNNIPVKQKDRIALFTVEKGITTHSAATSRRRRTSSSGRIGHLFTNIERQYPKRYVANPTINSMRSEKVKHIVFVDDIIGSGHRFIEHWRANVPRTIKSWLSYKVCKLWIVTYAIHPVGLKKIKEQLLFLRSDDIKTHLFLPQRFRNWNSQVKNLCQVYADRTKRPGVATGFGDIMIPIVFQFGCPNNAPAILWSKGKSWNPLFPERSIPQQLYKYFIDNMPKAWYGDLLADSNQYKLGLTILDKISKNEISDSSAKLATMLGLLLQKVKVEKLPSLMFCSKKEITSLFQKAKEYYFIDTNNEVSDFGRDLVYRFKNRGRNPKRFSLKISQMKEYYYPKQFATGSAKV